ncbi:MAG: pilus assembly protein PilM [Proteobacteria bacterium]|nr:pilus assembly protein PilM [Pseudomonadota bacterium]
MTRAVGIDIGLHTIKIAEIDFTNRDSRLLGLYEIDLENGGEDAVESKLQSFFNSQSIKPERIAVGLGPIPILFKKMALPFSDRRKAELAIRNEFEDSLPFSLDNYVLELQNLGKNKRVSLFQSALCQQSYIDKLNAHFLNMPTLTLNHFMLDNEALARLALWQHPSELLENKKTFCVCDIGYRSTKISLIKQQASTGKKWKDLGESILEFRTISKGLQELFDWMSVHKRISQEDLSQWLKHRARILNAEETAPDSLSAQTSDEMKTALKPLLVEIYQTLQSFKTKQGLSPDSIILTGSITQIAGFNEFLASELRMPVEIWDIYKNFQVTPTLQTPDRQADFALAVALANRYNPNILVPSLNFKRSSLANKKIVSSFVKDLLNPANRNFWYGVLATFVFLFTYNALNMFFASNEETQLKKQLIEELRAADPVLGKRALNFYHDPTRTREIFDQEKSKILRNYAHSSESRLNLLLALSQDLPSGITVQNLEIKEAAKGDFLRLQIDLPATAKPSDKDSIKDKLTKQMEDKGFLTLKFTALKGNSFLWEAQRKGVSL